jgi:flagellin
MSNNSVTLSSSMSKCLYSLQSATALMSQTQEKLSTGKKVNSALDDPINYFAAQEHTQRATDLQARKDSMSEGIQTIKAADEGVSAILDLIDSAKSLAQSALSSTDESSVQDYVDQFNDLLGQIDDLASDSDYSGVNLLGGSSQTLDIFFDESNSSSITLTGIDGSSAGLGLTLIEDNVDLKSGAATNAWGSYDTTSSSDPDATFAVNKTNINAAIDALNDAKSTLRANEKVLSTQLNTVTTRQDFTSDMIAVMNDGAATLVNCDTNEESAKLLTLQTQQQLAMSALNIASQSAQSVLNLF